MNKQKLVIFLGCILILLITLFPPYIIKEENGIKFLGYHCIFSPPKFRISISNVRSYDIYGYSRIGSLEDVVDGQIDFSRLKIQIASVVIITTGLFFVFKKDK